MCQSWSRLENESQNPFCLCLKVSHTLQCKTVLTLHSNNLWCNFTLNCTMKNSVRCDSWNKKKTNEIIVLHKLYQEIRNRQVQKPAITSQGSHFHFHTFWNLESFSSKDLFWIVIWASWVFAALSWTIYSIIFAFDCLDNWWFSFSVNF